MRVCAFEETINSSIPNEHFLLSSLEYVPRLCFKGLPFYIRDNNSFDEPGSEAIEASEAFVTTFIAFDNVCPERRPMWQILIFKTVGFIVG